MVRIKIKLDASEGTLAYNRLQEQWENEGGAVSIRSNVDLVLGDKIPFTPGDTFRILSGRMDFIDDDFYYIAEIEKIPDEVFD